MNAWTVPTEVLAVCSSALRAILPAQVPACHACCPHQSGDLHLAEQCMEGLETVASGLEQIAHHPAGKTALRESDAIKRESERCQACSGPVRLVHRVYGWLVTCAEGSRCQGLNSTCMQW
jgi:hypothetical protein